VETSPAVINGMVYVGSDDGNVYAFGLPDASRNKYEPELKRPDVKTLRPDVTLKVGGLVATVSEL